MSYHSFTRFLLDCRLAVARLNGNVDFLELEVSPLPAPSTIPPPPTVTSVAPPTRVQKRGHRRVASNPYTPFASMSVCDVSGCVLHATTRAHQRPLTALAACGRKVVSASSDHTLKVNKQKRQHSNDVFAVVKTRSVLSGTITAYV